MRWSVGLGLVVVACGGGTPRAEEPESESAMEAPAAAEAAPVPVESTAGTSEGGGETNESGAQTAKPGNEAPSTPEFKEGMSVDEAIAVVPRDAQRMNLDSDALGKPLMQDSLYAPCKLAHTQHFKVRVAIWNGKAVGLDLATQPKNPKAEACIASQIRALTWPDKVPSLNTVEYSM